MSRPAVQAERHELPEPSVSYVGPAAVWWIPILRGPRISLRWAVIAWLILLPLMAGTALWVEAESQTLWPFGRRVHNYSEIVFRYELIALVCATYLTIPSLPVWFHYRRLARQDVQHIRQAVQSEQWERAGLFLHRYCLLISAIWRKLPARVAAWDSILRPRLPRHRRLYVYHRADRPPPELPANVAAGFGIRVVRVPGPSLWLAAALVPVALLIYFLLVDVVQQGDPRRVFLVNTVLLSVLFVSYTMYFVARLLGQSSFLRFAPGVLQRVEYPALHRRPHIETCSLRQTHAALDLSSAWPGLTLLEMPHGGRETYRLPRNADTVEAVFRAALSTVPSPPMPEDELTD